MLAMYHRCCTLCNKFLRNIFSGPKRNPGWWAGVKEGEEMNCETGAIV
jgi:hypothetical protein